MKTKTCILYILFALLVNATFSQESPQNGNLDFPRRNSIYIQNLLSFPTLYYDRVIPIYDHFGIIPKLGILYGWGYGNAILFETSIFIGGNKHYGEIGVGIWNLGAIVPIKLNYRYIGEKGLLIKVGGSADKFVQSPFLSIGYSF